MKTEEQNLLEQALNEIRSLRRQNELMHARLNMFDDLNQILHTVPASQSQGMSPDLAWSIEKFLMENANQKANG